MLIVEQYIAQPSIMIVLPINDVSYVGIKDGYRIYANQPPVPFDNPARRFYHEKIGILGSSGIYHYDAHEQVIKKYEPSTDQIQLVGPIDNYLPMRFRTLLMTSSTPFYLYDNGKMMIIYARSFIWTFDNKQLVSKLPLMRDRYMPLIDVTANTAVVVHRFGVLMTQIQNNVRWSHTYGPDIRVFVYHYPQRINLYGAVSNYGFIGYDTHTQTTVYTYNSHIFMLESGHKDYCVCNNQVFATANDRLVMLDIPRHLTINRGGIRLSTTIVSFFLNLSFIRFIQCVSSTLLIKDSSESRTMD